MGVSSTTAKRKEKRRHAARRTYRIFAERKGMTLIEIMTALALMVIVFSGFVTLVTASAQMNIKAETIRKQYEAQEEGISMGSGLSSQGATIQLKVGSKFVYLPVTVKTTEGSEPLAIFN